MRHHSIERLESRIAPATLLPGGRGFTFTDADGDLVTVKTSKGSFDLAENAFFAAVGVGEELRTLQLAAGGSKEFEGANISITVKKVQGGDGRTDVREVFALGVNLGAVKIAGDLEQIAVGSNTAGVSAIKSLSVTTFGLAQNLGGIGQSLISGRFGSINVTESFYYQGLKATGGGGNVTIGESLVGGFVAQSGILILQGKVGNITVGGGLIGGAGGSSGTITFEQAGAVKIGNAGLAFGGGLQSGSLAGLSASSVTIGGSISGESSLIIHGAVKTVTIGGSLEFGGTINAVDGSRVGAVTIKGDVSKVNRPGNEGPTLTFDTLGTLTVQGSILGQFAGGDTRVLAVRDTITTFTVKGNIDGGNGDKMTFAILGTGDDPKAKIIGAMNVSGNVSNAYFSLGNGASPVTSKAVVGKITIGEDWTTNTISAGSTQGPNPPVFPAPFNAVKGPVGVVLEGLTIRGEAKVNGSGIKSVISADDVKAITIKGRKAPLEPGVDELLFISDALANEVMVVREV